MDLSYINNPKAIKKISRKVRVWLIPFSLFFCFKNYFLKQFHTTRQSISHLKSIQFWRMFSKPKNRNREMFSHPLLIFSLSALFNGVFFVVNPPVYQELIVTCKDWRRWSFENGNSQSILLFCQSISLIIKQLPTWKKEMAPKHTRIQSIILFEANTTST